MIETVPWPMAAKAAKAAKKAGKWQRWVLEAAERFMVRWHENDATLSRKRHASVMGGVQENGKGGASVVGKPRLTKAGMKWQTGYLVARYQIDQ